LCRCGGYNIYEGSNDTKLQLGQTEGKVSVWLANISLCLLLNPIIWFGTSKARASVWRERNQVSSNKFGLSQGTLSTLDPPLPTTPYASSHKSSLCMAACCWLSCVRPKFHTVETSTYSNFLTLGDPENTDLSRSRHKYRYLYGGTEQMAVPGAKPTTEVCIIVAVACYLLNQIPHQIFSLFEQGDSHSIPAQRGGRISSLRLYPGSVALLSIARRYCANLMDRAGQRCEEVPSSILAGLCRLAGTGLSTVNV